MRIHFHAPYVRDLDERETAGEAVTHVDHVRLPEANDDVGFGVRRGQMREFEVVVVEVQRRRVFERDHRQCLG